MTCIFVYVYISFLMKIEWTMLKCALTVFPVFVFRQIVCGELSSLEMSVINLALLMSLVMNWTILPIVVVLPLAPVVVFWL